MTCTWLIALAGLLASLTGQDPAVTQTELPPPGQQPARQQASTAPEAPPVAAPAPQKAIAPVAPQQGIKTNEEMGPGRRVAAFWFIVPPRS